MASILRSLSASGSSKLALGAAAAAAAAAAAGYAISRSATNASCKAAAAKRLDPNSFLPFTLASKEKLTHDTYKLVFHHDDRVTYAEALPPASCLLARLPTGKLKEDGTPSFYMRPYTAVNLPGDVGTIDLVVKDYEGGKMSSALCALKPGQVCEMKGPISKIPISTNKWKHVGCIAGGTGITPMYQCIVTSFADKADKTKYSLVYGSRSRDDIILKKELDELARAHPGRLEITYLVDKGPLPEGGGHVGYVTAGLLKSALPEPSKDSIILTCGPPPLVNLITGPKAKDKSQGELVGLLKDLGYSAENVFKF